MLYCGCSETGTDTPMWGRIGLGIFALLGLLSCSSLFLFHF